VTRQMWADLKAVQPTLPDDPSRTDISPTMNHPVQRNTWYEAVLFANLMSVQYGYTRCYYKDAGFTTPVDASNYTSGSFYCNFDATGYRLPTEAEWEYAARAGTTGPFSTHEPNYSSGNCSTCSPSPPLNVLDSIAWWCGNSDTGSGRMAHPVGTKLANPWGLYDMHGNVWEWCWDWFGSYPSGPVTDPTGPITGSFRVFRGGSWSGLAQFCRSAIRYYEFPVLRNGSLGFRLLRSTN
jgi:formylglycine-generating enzyme